ncbi:MAG: DUF305 domain-containing protein [Mycobacteriales bacterium]|nr:DUF305 domain-containing protein [Mycobacteriales bacterium]
MRTSLLATSLLSAALVLTACGSNTDTASSDDRSSDSSSSSAKGNDADVAFLQGMTPHHEQAVLMSDLVLAAGPPAGVADLARRIKAAQSPEIDQMTSMLKDLGATADSGGQGGGHSSGGMDGMGAEAHEGMMSDADLATLKDARGVDAARLYLEAMIVHHQGAIKASDAQLADGVYGPARMLAESIAKAQAAEIAEMRQLLASL